MNKKFTYTAFGLTINSEFEIPELIETTGPPDLTIKLGNVPEQLEQVTKKGVKYQATKDQFLLEVDRIAKFYVQDGRQITVDLLKEKADREVRLFLLGSAFGALFIQRGLLPIHGSAIKFGDSVSVFSGLSGVGKSSLAATFVKKGFQFLADDISVVNDELNVMPGFPNMKIWDDVLKKLHLKTDSLSEVRPDIKKYDLRSDQQFCNEALKLTKVFILNTKNSHGFDYEELSGLAKFNAIKNNTYRYRFVGGLEKQPDHFRILNKLLPNIKVYRISRPQSPILLNELADYLMETFQLNE
jgi:hypothetical protein